MSKRFDKRSKEQFIQDIKQRTLKERELFLKWIDFQEQITGVRITFRDKGKGRLGEYLSEKEVSLDADFEVDGWGPVEVKYSDPLLTNVFHLKVGQVKSYIKQDCILLMFNGAATDHTQFTILNTNSLQSILKNAPVVNFQGFGGKPAFKIKVDDYVWRTI